MINRVRENGSTDEIPFLEMCLSEKPTFQQKRDGVLRGGRDLRTSSRDIQNVEREHEVVVRRLPSFQKKKISSMHFFGFFKF